MNQNIEVRLRLILQISFDLNTTGTVLHICVNDEGQQMQHFAVYHAC